VTAIPRAPLIVLVKVVELGASPVNLPPLPPLPKGFVHERVVLEELVALELGRPSRGCQSQALE
jgi:hypothetical protein